MPALYPLPCRAACGGTLTLCGRHVNILPATARRRHFAVPGFQPDGLGRNSLGQRPRLRAAHALPVFVQPEGLGRSGGGNARGPQTMSARILVGDGAVAISRGALSGLQEENDTQE